MIPSPEDFEIIDAHTHPFIDMAGCVAAYGHPNNMDEFDYEMKKVGINHYAGSLVVLSPCPLSLIIRQYANSMKMHCVSVINILLTSRAFRCTATSRRNRLRICINIIMNTESV